MEIENRVSALKLVWWIIRFLILYLLMNIFVVNAILIVLQFLPLITFDPSEDKFLIINLLAAIISFVYIAIHLKYIDKQNENWLKIKLNQAAGYEFLKGLVGGILIFVIFFNLFILFISPSIMFNEAFSLQKTIYILFILFILAFFEEYMFRGYFFNLIKKHSSFFWGTFISSIIFLIFHLGNKNIGVIGIVNIFEFGVLLALIYERCKNLYLITGIHFIWNFLTIFSGFQVSGVELDFLPAKITFIEGPEILTGGLFGPEGSIITTIILTALIVWYILKIKNMSGGKIESRIFV